MPTHRTLEHSQSEPDYSGSQEQEELLYPTKTGAIQSRHRKKRSKAKQNQQMALWRTKNASRYRTYQRLLMRSRKPLSSEDPWA